MAVAEVDVERRPRQVRPPHHLVDRQLPERPLAQQRLGRGDDLRLGDLRRPPPPASARLDSPHGHFDQRTRCTRRARRGTVARAGRRSSAVEHRTFNPLWSSGSIPAGGIGPATFLPDWKVRARLSNMESSPHRPTAAEASAALLDAEASRATLAGHVATPSWFFASLGVAIAVQIAATAVGLGGGAPWLLAVGRRGVRGRRGRAARAVPAAQRRLARRLRQPRRAGHRHGRLAVLRRRGRRGDLGGVRRALVARGAVVGGGRRGVRAVRPPVDARLPRAIRPRTRAASRSRGSRCCSRSRSAAWRCSCSTPDGRARRARRRPRAAQAHDDAHRGVGGGVRHDARRAGRERLRAVQAPRRPRGGRLRAAPQGRPPRAPHDVDLADARRPHRAERARQPRCAR